MKMSCEIWSQNTKDCSDNSKRVRLKLNDLTFEKDLINGNVNLSFQGSINGFSLGPLCISQATARYSSLEDLISASINL